MKTFNFRFWTGPTQVQDVAEYLGANAGTEYVYGQRQAESALKVQRDVYLALTLKYSGYRLHDVQVTEVTNA